MSKINYNILMFRVFQAMVFLVVWIGIGLLLNSGWWYALGWIVAIFITQALEEGVLISEYE